MPTPEALAREDDVLARVCEALSDTRRTVTIEERPDRLPPGQRVLNVDALLRVRCADEERIWAADVCTVPLPQEVAGAIQAFEQRTLPELDQVACEAGRALTVAYRPRLFPDRVDAKTRKRRHDADAEAAVEAARQAARLGRDHPPKSGDELGLQILLHDRPTHADGSRVSFAPFVSGSGASITDQLRRDLAPHVCEKLDKQLKGPRTTGYPTVLVLDQHGHPGMRVPTNFLASPATIRLVLGECVAKHPGVLDACVLIDPNNRVWELIGRIGTPVHDTAA
ncbi:hypothetical protein LI90_4287 [Carbonactinospora thermoautotrophica]|uniref:Uncharacterized protein n=1 Tax=Carbonactinospora thermoautotrophica TaxID=1469144 RepID=A0A132MZS8_9ACTN|nr:hypothetical protein [Carbonactinospora thermoautotrophica]KWX03236.1 hypothetical protein LI90_4287 [Carbonactinospora thermoautotrophica]